MPTFQPSKYSASGEAALPNPASTVVSDSGGARYMIRSNGIIEVLDDTWGNKGALFHPGSPVYDQMLKNLSAADSSNNAKISEVLGSAAFQKALSTPALPANTSTGTGAKGGASTEEIVTEASMPLTKRPWFWPAVILGVAGIAGVAFVYWPKGEEAEGVNDGVPA